MKHTPGPWIVEREELWIGPRYKIRGQHSETLAEVWNQHDARLIAAAPELLEALEEAYAWIKDGMSWFDSYEGPGVTIADEKLFAKIEAAIAKARGES